MCKSDIEKCRKIVERFTESLPKTIDPDLRTLSSQIPFRVICFKNTLIHRVAHLSFESIELQEKNFFLSSLIIARSALETAALLFFLDKKIESSIRINKTEELESFIEKALIGSRNGDTEKESLNILTAIDHIEKEYQEFGYFYRDLSEYAHPNFAGLLGAYTRLSEDKNKLIFGFNDLKITSIEPLMATLLVTDHYNTEVDKKFNKLLEICDLCQQSDSART